MLFMLWKVHVTSRGCFKERYHVRKKRNRFLYSKYLAVLTPWYVHLTLNTLHMIKHEPREYKIRGRNVRCTVLGRKSCTCEEYKH